MELCLHPALIFGEVWLLLALTGALAWTLFSVVILWKIGAVLGSWLRRVYDRRRSWRPSGSSSECLRPRAGSREDSTPSARELKLNDRTRGR
jgi:hypothetical protein